MTETFEILTRINLAIGEAENCADRDFFTRLLHSRFTMRKPNGDLATKEEFIAGLHTRAGRETIIESIRVEGEFTATARTITRKWDLDRPDEVVHFDNLRVFCFDEGRWQLLTWLAEPLD